jgi:hypothetical protein
MTAEKQFKTKLCIINNGLKIFVPKVLVLLMTIVIENFILHELVVFRFSIGFQRLKASFQCLGSKIYTSMQLYTFLPLNAYCKCLL